MLLVCDANLYGDRDFYWESQRYGLYTSEANNDLPCCVQSGFECFVFIKCSTVVLRFDEKHSLISASPKFNSFSSVFLAFLHLNAFSNVFLRHQLLRTVRIALMDWLLLLMECLKRVIYGIRCIFWYQLQEGKIVQSATNFHW